MSDAKEAGYTVEMKQSSFSIRYINKYHPKQMLSLLGVYASGNIYVDFLPNQLKDLNLPVDIADHYWHQLGKILSGCEYKGGSNERQIKEAIPKYSDILSAMGEVVSEIDKRAGP